MWAISTAKGSIRFWYDALDDVVALLAYFYRTSSKRIHGLLRKGGKFCFSRRTGVRWVEAMFYELDIVLENLLAVLLHLPEYIEVEADSRRRDKAEGSFATPLQGDGCIFFAMFLLWFVPRARKSKQPRVHKLMQCGI